MPAYPSAHVAVAPVDGKMEELPAVVEPAVADTPASRAKDASLRAIVATVEPAIESAVESAVEDYLAPKMTAAAEAFDSGLDSVAVGRERGDLQPLDRADWAEGSSSCLLSVNSQETSSHF